MVGYKAGHGDEGYHEVESAFSVCTETYTSGKVSDCKVDFVAEIAKVTKDNKLPF